MTNESSGYSVYDSLASRWARLGAALIDAVIAMLVAIPVVTYLGLWDAIARDALPARETIMFALFGWTAFLAIHGYLLNRYGQTVGKALLGIAIVNLDGGKPDFWPLLGKRYVPIALAAYVPVIGQLLPTIDVLFIFRKDKRCIHDLIADTVVVDHDEHNLRREIVLDERNT